jgi:hypothetical protein
MRARERVDANADALVAVAVDRARTTTRASLARVTASGDDARAANIARAGRALASRDRPARDGATRAARRKKSGVYDSYAQTVTNRSDVDARARARDASRYR